MARLEPSPNRAPPTMSRSATTAAGTSTRDGAEAWQSDTNGGGARRIPLDLGLEGALSLLAPRRQLFALDLAGRTEAKGIDDERVVVLLFTLLVRPIVGTNVGLKNELIALARIFGDRLAERLECHEPEAGDPPPP